MKYLAILLLLITGCNKEDPSPKFKFRDEVIVVGGFYKGLGGEVRDYSIRYSSPAHTTYIISRNDSPYTITVEEVYLELKPISKECK